MIDELSQKDKTKTVTKNNMVFITGGKFLMGSDKFYPKKSLFMK
jgi:hypothetical protein